jgi:hypothetical protein
MTLIFDDGRMSSKTALPLQMKHKFSQLKKGRYFRTWTPCKAR